MGIFRRPPKTASVRPTEEQVRQAAAEFNRGNTRPADELATGSGDYRQETAMRIFRYLDCLEP